MPVASIAGGTADGLIGKNEAKGQVQRSRLLGRVKGGVSISSRVYSVTIDAHDIQAQAEFWRQVLGYEITYAAPEEVAIEPPEGKPGPALVFVPVPEPKTVKNRIHLDLNPDNQAAEVERLESLAARRIDIGQGEVSWVVMADPEGNEFCVLTARE